MPSKRKAAQAVAKEAPEAANDQGDKTVAAADPAEKPAEETDKKEEEKAPATNGDAAAPAVNGKDKDKKDEGAKDEAAPAGDEKKKEGEGEKKEEKKKNDEKKEGDKDIKEEEKPAKKPVKKTIPIWATVPKTAGSSTKQAVEVGSGGMAGAAVSVMEELTDVGGMVSSLTLKKELMKRCPTWKKWMVKKAVTKAVEKGRLKQVKGSFKLMAASKAKPAAAASKSKAGKGKAKKDEPAEKLDDLLGNIFTWICEPKESSISLIRKYIEAHHTQLSTSEKDIRKAIELGIKKGQLERLNGAGLSGTLALVDQAKKTGAKYEDAIEDAIIACNEPKDASIPALRHYLSENHKEYNVAARPQVLYKCLERAEAKGWVKRLTGKGKSGSFRLVVPYRPSPKDLWREWYEEEDEDEPPKKKRKPAKAKQESSDEEESSSEEEEEEDSDSEDDEPVYVPKKGKRGPPSPRKAVVPKKKATPAKKAPAKKTPAKKTPAKKAAKEAPVTAKKSKPPPPPPAKKKAAAAGKKRGRK